MDPEQQNNTGKSLQDAADAFVLMSKKIAESIKKMALLQRVFRNKETKHNASKKGHAHEKGRTFKQNKVALPTNHQRVVMSRAAKLGLTVKEYEVRYMKGER